MKILHSNGNSLMRMELSEKIIQNRPLIVRIRSGDCRGGRHMALSTPTAYPGSSACLLMP